MGDRWFSKRGEFMKKVVDAGIDFIRISIIGYNKEKYGATEFQMKLNLQ